MDCPFLQGNEHQSCGAVDSPVILSGCELQTFCRDGHHTSCPVYNTCRKMNIKLKVNQYYAIYSCWIRKNSYEKASA